MISEFGFWSNRTKEMKRKLKTKFYIDISSDHERSIILAGYARSGTTWLAEVINYNNEYRYIFEPFHAEYIAECKNLKHKKYIRSDSDDQDIYSLVKRIISGQIRAHWSDRFNRRIICNKRLIKTVRANLFLRWMKNQFPDLPIIFLIRHPCAVAVSQAKLKWPCNLHKYLIQEELMSDFCEPFRLEMQKSEENYAKSNDGFENYIFSWCIEHFVLLKQFKYDEINFVFYEKFCSDPEIEIRKIFSYLGKKYDNKILSKVRSASKLSRRDSPIITGSDLVGSWQKDVTEKQLSRTIEVLEVFGLDKLYSYDSMPQVDNLNLIMKS